MQRHITAGLDGSRESLDAADWAAREAVRRGLPLHLLHVDGEPAEATSLPELDVPAERERTALDRAAVRLAYCHPALEIRPAHALGRPADTLVEASVTSEALVLGSRGFTGFAAFLVGSVALDVTARAACPVVLVRAGERPEDERRGLAGTGPYRPVVLGLDLAHPCDDLLGYAFDAAASRHAPLHVLHAWSVPLVPSADADDPAAEKARALSAALSAWQHKFPDTEVREHAVHGRAGHHLLLASTRASLLVIGRRTGMGDRLGPVAHSVIHHVLCPVAVVPPG
ncbi:universal stress protein [Streptomyces melanogenes]|uniref:universal stress protein n=1 Tax=Streptomyces melanogenes TaxID=67326 RepID=UPI00167DE529|nr:universal stress protein [Streptomyces melanogenes]GGP94212.1 stress-inducible protein [Streptomyces melanogenes]